MGLRELRQDETILFYSAFPRAREDYLKAAVRSALRPEG
jgi:hypothetical protein